MKNHPSIIMHLLLWVVYYDALLTGIDCCLHVHSDEWLYCGYIMPKNSIKQEETERMKASFTAPRPVAAVGGVRRQPVGVEVLRCP